MSFDDKSIVVAEYLNKNNNKLVFKGVVEDNPNLKDDVCDVKYDINNPKKYLLCDPFFENGRQEQK